MQPSFAGVTVKQTWAAGIAPTNATTSTCRDESQPSASIASLFGFPVRATWERTFFHAGCQLSTDSMNRAGTDRLTGASLRCCDFAGLIVGLMPFNSFIAMRQM